MKKNEAHLKAKQRIAQFPDFHNLSFLSQNFWPFFTPKRMAVAYAWSIFEVWTFFEEANQKSFWIKKLRFVGKPKMDIEVQNNR